MAKFKGLLEMLKAPKEKQDRRDQEERRGLEKVKRQKEKQEEKERRRPERGEQEGQYQREKERRQKEQQAIFHALEINCPEFIKSRIY